MKLKRSLVLLSCLSAMLMLSPFAKPASAEQFVLKAASTLPANHKLNKYVYEPYMKEIERITNGQVKFKYYPAGTLVKSSQSVEAVKKGIIDVVFPMSVWRNEDQYPVSRIVGFPFVVDSASHGAITLSKAFDEIPEFRKEFANVKVLGFSCTGIANLALAGNKMPKSLNELKGLTVWAGSRKSIDVAKALGMNPRSMKLGDLFMSLQRGAVNGALFAMAPAKAYKLVDNTSNWMVMNAYVSLQPSAMNKKTWNRLPRNIQRVFDDMRDGLTKLTGLTIDNESAAVEKALKKRGDRFYYLSDEQRRQARQATQAIFDAYVKQLNSAGMNGKAILRKVEAIAAETKQPDISWGIVEN